MTEIDVEHFFQELKDETTSRWGGEVRIDVDGADEPLYCDYYYMKEVLLNLTDNAIDAMGESGVLTFTCRRPRKNIVLISVSDTGRGIPKEEIPRLFTLYYSSHHDAAHFGMGLPYCQKVVRAHGGYIQVESFTDADRHGTEFTICLPGDCKRKSEKM